MTTGRLYRRFKRTGLLLAILLLLSFSPVLAQEPEDEAQSPFAPRFGIVDSFTDTAEANAAGAGWTRVFFRWDVVQPGGPSDWKPTNVPDNLLNAEIAAGREVVAVLIGTPAWATESRTSTAVPPREFWGDFVFKIANQYKGRIRHWVIWNQPDVDDPSSPSYTWDGSVEEYALLLKEAYTKIKAVDPLAQVHIAGLTYTWDQERGNRQYLARLLEVITADPEAADYNYFFDAVTYHAYYNPIQLLQIITNARNVLNSFGLNNKTIWINETNAPPTEDFIEPPTGPTALTVTLDEQSAYVVQAFALALAGGAERIAFYKMSNSKEHPESAVPYGLLRGDGSRRPAFHAFRTVSTHFAGVQEADWVQFGDVYVVTLDQGDKTTTVLWNTARTPATYSLNAIAPQATLVDERANVETVVATNGSYDLELPAAACSNGDYCFIGGAPRLIIEEGASEQRESLGQTQAQPTAAPTATSPPPPTETPLAPPPTLTPALSEAPATTAADSTPAAPTPSPTDERPATAEESLPVPANAEQGPPPSSANTLPDPDAGEPPQPGALPDPDFDPLAAEGEQAADAAATPSTVPPVTITSVLTPSRILWLFIIGLVVFTITYGLQVIIWYRLKR